MTFSLAFQADACYGSKLPRVRREAERILEQEGELLRMPRGGITKEMLDEMIAEREAELAKKGERVSERVSV
jgi:hypothetical protein